MPASDLGQAVRTGGSPASAVPAGRGRVAGLDGLRGLAALYVVVFHCWLMTFRGFPNNPGPVWLGWLRYGHLAVVFFLALSGFSLALAPAGRDWRLGGALRFARRRAWRILPPYWAALAFSLAVAWSTAPQPHTGGPPTGSSVLVYGLLLQDFVITPVPNGAFWSIAVEAELYVVFPLLLLLRRRVGAPVLLAAVTVPVVVLGLVAPGVSPVDKLHLLTPQLAPLFVMGLVGAGIVGAPERVRRLPWHWLAAAAAAPVLLLMVAGGLVWTVRHYFWIDLAVGPPIVLLLTAVTTGRPAWLVRLLATWPMRRLGSFSYTLYLVHLPIVVLISHQVARRHLAHGVAAFWVTAAVAVPVVLGVAWAFASVFEIPFQRYRSWPALRDRVTKYRTFDQ